MAPLEGVTDHAATTFLQTWTVIATTARRLHEGLPNEALLGSLKRQRPELLRARNNLEQLTFMLNQMLDNEKLWDPVYLANFPDDERWQSFLPHLDELYSTYFGSNTNS
jgi:hypothetical protein